MKKEKAAAYICAGEKCFHAFDCGVDKQYNPLPKIGDGTVCPLQKYGMPEKRYVPPKDLIKAMCERPDNDELFNGIYKLCQNCEFSDKLPNGDFDRDKNFMTKCIDCPVYSMEEGMHETIAEAMMS